MCELEGQGIVTSLLLLPIVMAIAVLAAVAAATVVSQSACMHVDCVCVCAY